jgi:NitT/TauT family transport system substrate-binding protein
MTDKIKRSICALAAMLFGTIISLGSAAAQPTKVKFVLDWAWQAPHAAWTLAIDNGHFAAEGLEVSIDRGFGSGDTVSKVAAKTYDIGFADGNVLLKFNAANPDDQLMTVLIVLDASPNSVVFLNKSGIKVPKDLEGKTLATTENDGTNLIFPIFAQANNLDVSKIKFKHVQSNLRDTLVIQGEAEGSLGWATTAVMNMMTAGVDRDKIGYLAFSDHGVNLFSSGLVVRKDFAENHPKVVQGFVRATIKGIKDLVANPEVGVASIKKRDSLLDERIELIRYNLIRDVALITPHVKANGISSVDRERFERAAAQVAAAFNLDMNPKMEDTYTDQFLPPKLERMLPR